MEIRISCLYMFATKNKAVLIFCTFFNLFFLKFLWTRIVLALYSYSLEFQNNQLVSLCFMFVNVSFLCIWYLNLTTMASIPHTKGNRNFIGPNHICVRETFWALLRQYPSKNPSHLEKNLYFIPFAIKILV